MSWIGCGEKKKGREMCVGQVNEHWVLYGYSCMYIILCVHVYYIMCVYILYYVCMYIIWLLDSAVFAMLNSILCCFHLSHWRMEEEKQVKAQRQKQEQISAYLAPKDPIKWTHNKLLYLLFHQFLLVWEKKTKSVLFSGLGMLTIFFLLALMEVSALRAAQVSLVRPEAAPINSSFSQL